LHACLDKRDVNVKDVKEGEEKADANDTNEQVGERPDGDTVLTSNNGSTCAARFRSRERDYNVALFGCHEIPLSHVYLNGEKKHNKQCQHVSSGKVTLSDNCGIFRQWKMPGN